MPIHTVLYDDECSLCTFQMRALSWLDWNNRLAFIPISSPRAAQMAPALTPADLQEAIHCVSATGDIHRGARAIRFIGFRLPGLLPIALFLWIPGVIFLAEIVYSIVSRNRHLLGRVFGCKEACQILPPKQRPQDTSNSH